MGHLFCLMGKSSSGKDTLYRKILQDGSLPLLRIVPYTTRPARFGEADGVEYYFTDEEQLAKLQRAGKVIELRAYHTVHGVWKYFTVDDGQIDLGHQNYLMIATLEAYVDIRAYFGTASVVPLYVEVEDGVRLQRALEREQQQIEPKYAELCRRYLADEDDFSEEKIRAAGILVRFRNDRMEEACSRIKDYIRAFL